MPRRQRATARESARRGPSPRSVASRRRCALERAARASHATTTRPSCRRAARSPSRAAAWRVRFRRADRSAQEQNAHARRRAERWEKRMRSPTCRNRWWAAVRASHGEMGVMLQLRLLTGLDKRWDDGRLVSVSAGAAAHSPSVLLLPVQERGDDGEWYSGLCFRTE